MSSSLRALVIFARKEVVDDAEKCRELLQSPYCAGEVRVIFHEVVGMDLDVVFVLIFEKQIVIEAFRPFLFEQPVTIMTLPCNVE